MVNSSRQFSAVFDELLARDRKQLDDLLGGSTRAAPNDKASASRSTATIRTSHATATNSRVTPTGEMLNTKYGMGGWRHHIRERRVEGDEAIVLCELSVAAQNISKTQFGSAKISAVSSGVAGQAQGVSFSLAGHSNSNTSDETEALERASEAALAKCAALL